MTGFGRTGTWFACEHWGLRPDILVAGKGASSGYWPLGLVVASGAVHDTVQDAGGFVHGFTWSHHPGGAAVGRAVLERMRADDLVERSRVLGDRLLDQLRDALVDVPIVGDVRGRGLLVGVELVTDRATKTPFPRADRIAERVTERGEGPRPARLPQHRLRRRHRRRPLPHRSPTDRRPRPSSTRSSTAPRPPSPPSNRPVSVRAGVAIAPRVAPKGGRVSGVGGGGGRSGA